jgi:hypothetical protein
MPPQTQAQLPSASEPDSAQEGPSRVSRRSLLRGAGAVGVAGVAAAGGAGAVVALVRPKAEPVLLPAAKPVALAAMPPNAMAGPLVVYLADTATGEMDVFAGTGQIRLRNPAMVGQLLRNLQMAQ